MIQTLKKITGKRPKLMNLSVVLIRHSGMNDRPFKDGGCGEKAPKLTSAECLHNRVLLNLKLLLIKYMPL